MCSSSLIYLLDLWESTEEVKGGQVTANFLLDFHQVQKESGGGDKSTSLFPELTLSRS
jgi:hypothetical protein